MLEGGLRKLAIHIDVTQAGRPGFPKRDITREAELHPLRQHFVDLILGSRKRTRVRFAAAHTVTVTSQNLSQVGDVVQWLLNHPDRLKAFRMLSLQPEADVGRTRMGESTATPEACWAEVEAVLGFEAARDNLWFGDPACSRMTTLLVLYPEGRIVDAIPSDDRTRALWGRIYDVFGGVGGRGADQVDANLRRLALLWRQPRILGEIMGYVRARAREERLGLGTLLGKALFGRIGALNIVQHNFMDASEIRSQDSAVQRRLQACAFRGAVQRQGTWQAVPMCTLNTDQREAIYESQIAQE